MPITPTITRLSLAHGANVRRDRVLLACHSRDGIAWSNNSGTLRGEGVEYVSGDAGQLPSDWRSRLDYDIHSRGVDRLVWSYSTIVAWRIRPNWEYPDGMWVIPPVHYSPTTDRHQSILRAELTPQDLAGPWARR